MATTVNENTATVNFALNQGSHWQRRIQLQDGNGDPIDLTGYTARMQLRKYVDDTADLFELTTENGRIQIGDAAPTDGYVILTLTAIETAGIAGGNPRYDLELVPSSGDADAWRPLMGRVLVSKEVTR